MRNIFLFLFLAFIIIACSDKKQNPTQKQEIVKETEIINENMDSDELEPPYQLKEDGLYIYSDGPALYQKHDPCVDVIQKNYKYILVPSSKDIIKAIEGPRFYQNCAYDAFCEDNLGKPSLYELGYERHKEREIKPEDNRFGKEVKKGKVYTKYEKKIAKTIDYDVIPKSAFKIISRQEFIENGIVIIGKHISRVVIKSLLKLPKFPDDVAVGVYISKFTCDGKEDREVLLPEVIADFKKIHFKENIFEFIEEDPIPNNRAYLSDDQFIRLTNNIHQLIPRIFDRTIHNVATYDEGYYIIEYYNGDKLYDYHCIKISAADCAPKLWEPLKVQEPGSINTNPNADMFRLILADFNSLRDAEAFVYNNQLYDVFIYRLANGAAAIGNSFSSKENAELEFSRYLHRGFSKDKMRIEKY
jgi:hypothetical protein